LNSVSSKSYIEVVKLLLEQGADITVASNRAWISLNLASSKGYFEVVKLLLEQNTNITVAGNKE
jgi:ankyrin repeat protein